MKHFAFVFYDGKFVGTFTDNTENCAERNAYLHIISTVVKPEQFNSDLFKSIAFFTESETPITLAELRQMHDQLTLEYFPGRWYTRVVQFHKSFWQLSYTYEDETKLADIVFEDLFQVTELDPVD